LSLLRSPSPLAAAPHPPFLALHRPLSTAAAAPFVVDGYLVATCGLTRAQALKASKRLSHLRSPSKPDAVLAFLSARGLSRADIAAVVATDPRLLCASVEKNLSKRVAELGDLGLSRSQIARLILICRNSFRTACIGRNIAIWLPVLGSFDKLLQVVKMNSAILTVNPEKASKPNTPADTVRVLNKTHTSCRLLIAFLERSCTRRVLLSTREYFVSPFLFLL
ncbi:hypothetical protein BAE44_0016624, partial [Dichanthelium oligosanthes]